MYTLMAKLKQQQQSSSAVSGLLCSVMVAKFYVSNFLYPFGYRLSVNLS